MFGQFLLENNIISRIEIFRARLFQKKNNRKIGELANKRGWLTEDDIEKILTAQEETGKKFSEIALRENLLQKAQIDELLKEREDKYTFFGEALVKIGALSYEDLLKHLKDFNKLQG